MVPQFPASDVFFGCQGMPSKSPRKTNTFCQICKVRCPKMSKDVQRCPKMSKVYLLWISPQCPITRAQCGAVSVLLVLLGDGPLRATEIRGRSDSDKNYHNHNENHIIKKNTSKTHQFRIDTQSASICRCLFCSFIIISFCDVWEISPGHSAAIP